jgi:hypothetical protein
MFQLQGHQNHDHNSIGYAEHDSGGHNGARCDDGTAGDDDDRHWPGDHR